MARTDSTWVRVSNYMRSAAASGLDILIAGTNKYLNFGSSVGSDGYGIRDNGGTIEIKNSGGAWAAVATGGGEINTATSLGTGDADVYKQKTGVQFEFRSLLEGAGITLTQGTNSITISASGAAPAWGDITGTLANQTDLQAAIDAKQDSITNSDDITEGTTNLFLTGAERTKVGHITITQAVDLDAIETRVNELDAAVVLQGSWDASVGTFPGSGTAQAGHSWVVSVAGTVDSIDFAVGDRIVSILDNASTTVYASNWLKLDYTDKVSSVQGQTGVIVLDPDDLDDTSTTNKFTTASDISKLAGIEASADVTDTANVTAAGALMDSELADIVFIKAQSDAVASDINTGTSTTKVVTPDALAGSNLGIRYIQATVTDYTTDTATGDGQAYFHIPAAINGMNLVEVHAEVITAGTTGTTDVQIHNVTQAADMLTTKITIDSGETGSDTAASAAVIDTSNDDVATNDLLRVDVDAVSTTAAKGLIVTLGFQLP